MVQAIRVLTKMGAKATLKPDALSRWAGQKWKRDYDSFVKELPDSVRPMMYDIYKKMGDGAKERSRESD